MNSTIIIRRAFVKPPANQWDRSNEEARTSHRSVEISLEGDSQIYSKILAKLEELAKAEGWEIV